MTGEIKTIELRFKVPARPVSINETAGHHHRVGLDRLDEWKRATRIAYAQDTTAGHFVNVPCRIEIQLPFARHARRDPHNFIPTVKAIIDALRVGGAWPDDSPEWVQVVDPTIVVGDEVVIRLVPRVAEAAALGSRAVLRKIDAGNDAKCKGCATRLTFSAWKPKSERQQVICNVYENGEWDRVEHWHVACYKEAGAPHGKATA
jgi:hypothetical protein